MDEFIVCPYCGKAIDHNCAREIGRRGKYVITPRKRASSRRNMQKARDARWPKRNDDLIN